MHTKVQQGPDVSDHTRDIKEIIVSKQKTLFK
jgi:hypothetical protein